jgi:hypothetical protein
MPIPKLVFDYVKHALVEASKDLYDKEVLAGVGSQQVSIIPDEISVRFIMSEVCRKIEARKLIEEHGYWGDHPKYSVEDWRHATATENTRMSYWEWVVKQLNEEEV